MKRTRHQHFLKLFGIKLREIRKLKGLTQEKLSFMSDMELSTLNRIELGKQNTSLSQVMAIAEALDIHPKLLLEFELEIQADKPVTKKPKKTTGDK